ncbi:MAG: DNA-protecting protein DprA [Crocinitomicaceae bacterium]|nr:DNA-protecting protein DprA [Crocinitomicaceae bacterium]
MSDELVYQIALSLVPGIGPVKAKKLLSYCGSASAVFREKENRLLKIPDIGTQAIRFLSEADVMERAESEAEYMIKNDIASVFFTEKNYPDRLRHCDDSPIILFSKGNIPFNATRTVALVGTRHSTEYGKDFCEYLIRGIKHIQPVIISGLAYGIDILAHKYALREGLSTIACLAHGLHTVYPPAHRPVVNEMLETGGVVTEYLAVTNPEREMFPMRNRIIAALADCTVIVETGPRGGSIITANIASSYGRDVFALPGRYNDPHSSGCNELIRKNIAAILSSPGELLDYMNWENDATKQKPAQLSLFNTEDPGERLILSLLNGRGKVAIDVLCAESEKSISDVSGLLLSLEFKGLVKSLPGKLFQISRG